MYDHERIVQRFMCQYLVVFFLVDERKINVKEIKRFRKKQKTSGHF